MAVFHRIDRILFWLLLLGVLFIAAMAATGDNMPLAAALASAICLGFEKLFHALSAYMKCRSRKARRRYARSVLAQWALLPEDEAKEKIKKLFAGLPTPRIDEGPLSLLPLSPASDSFNADAVIALWKKSRNEPHITLAALCPAQADAKQWADKLENPSVSLIDGPCLEKRFIQTCPVVPASFSEAKRLSPPADWIERLLKRAHPAKAGIYALFMLLFYLLNGGLIRLAGFGVLLTLALLSLHTRLND